jgi:hypothetical protein
MADQPLQADSAESDLAESGSQVVRLVGFATVGFVIACAVLFAIASSIKPPERPSYAITNVATHLDGETWRVTLDVKDRHQWTGFSFSTGKRLQEVDPADLLGRRHHIRAPGGAIRLGDVPLEQATLPEEVVWEFDETEGDQIINPAFGKWYTYSYFTHMLDPIHQTYAVRLANGGRVVFVRLENYYCKPEGSGCLTFRYRLGPEVD